MPKPSPQIKYFTTVALKQAHTDIHKALARLEHNGSEIEAKRLMSSAIKKLAEALSNL